MPTCDRLKRWGQLSGRFNQVIGVVLSDRLKEKGHFFLGKEGYFVLVGASCSWGSGWRSVG